MIITIFILAIIGALCETQILENFKGEGVRQKRLLFYDEEGNLVKTYKDAYLQDLSLHVDKYPYYGNYLNPFFTFIKASYDGAPAAFAIPVSSEVVEQIQNDPVYQHKLVLTPKKDPIISRNALCEGKRTQVPSKNCHNFLNCWDGWAFEQECPEGLMFSREGYCDYSDNVDCSNRDILCKPEESKPLMPPAQPPKPQKPQAQPKPPVQPQPQPQPQQPTYPQPQLPSYPQPQPPLQPQPQPPYQPQPQPPYQPQPQPPYQPQPKPPFQPQPQPPVKPQPQPPMQPQQPSQPQPQPPSQPQPQPPAPSPIQVPQPQPQPCPHPQIPGQTQQLPQVPIPQLPQAPPQLPQAPPQLPEAHPIPLCKQDFESFVNQYNCNEFYVCVNRRPVKFQCPADLHYSEYLGVCDMAERVDCRSTPFPPAALEATQPSYPNAVESSKPAYGLSPSYVNYQGHMSGSPNIATSSLDAVRQLQGI